MEAVIKKKAERTDHLEHPTSPACQKIIGPRAVACGTRLIALSAVILLLPRTFSSTLFLHLTIHNVSYREYACCQGRGARRVFYSSLNGLPIHLNGQWIDHL